MNHNPMENQHFFPTLTVWEKALPVEQCFDIISKTKQFFPDQNAQIGGVGIDNEGKEDENIRRSEVRFIHPIGNPEADQFAGHIKGMVWDLMTNHNEMWWGMSLSDVQSIQYTEYGEHNKGYYNWHHDWAWGGPSTGLKRKMSMSIQLSDPTDYDGGEFKFCDPCVNTLAKERNLKWNKQGTALMFPSFMAHKVSPVTRGTRKSLVVWFKGVQVQ